MPNFEVFQPTTPVPGPHVPPTITITSTAVSLNKTALEALGRPRSVELLYDRDSTTVGIRAADMNAVTAIRLDATRDQGARAHTSVFAAEYGIPTNQRWTAFLNDRILCADVSEPGTPTAHIPRPTGFITAATAESPTRPGASR